MFKMIKNDAIFALASSIVKALINSPIDSKDGIVVLAQMTRFMHKGLNLTDQRVSQQHFGRDHGTLNNIIKRSSYGYLRHKGTKHFDVSKMITRPFSSPMVMMCHQVHACINSNITCLHLQNVDTSSVPNHLSILSYMAIPSL